MKNYILLFIAMVLDFILGDPSIPIHPVRLMGNLILKIENLLYNLKISKRVSGFFGVSISLFTVIILFFILNYLLGFIPFGKEVFSVLVFYFTIAIKDLAVHGLRIKKALDINDIPLARKRAGMILSRDTESLSSEKIIAGTIESMSENSSDSIIAPVFWGLILGPAGALVYRLINTMDAMWGYKNERFIDFGRTAAILDDIVNYIPARLTGILICLASGLIRFDSVKEAKNQLITSWQIMIRDHGNTASPNAGYPEAAIAGALGLQLGGQASYFGKIIEKPVIGENKRDPEPQDITKSLKIIVFTVILFIITAGIIILLKKTGS